ncbi:hypothetical protein H2204_001010 [Knufia peltigerae]|uniref:Major facilitator superfamily (MFS) profile domain-containing protein n=1 Tax=Knufia peltigerae TaxID=1002370 RepID=A0AA38YDH0_9EURO|nr:hypothetical protein H2204_001010 [Knufia peltigerae]
MAVLEEKTCPSGIAPVASSDRAAFEDVDFVPGTEYMGDSFRGHEQIQGNGKDHVTLVPQPSQDPHDPLNWSRLWKFVTIATSMVYSFLGGWVSLSLNPFFITLMTYFERSANDIAWLTSSLLLILGFANIITIPVAVCYGRRSAYLWSTLVTFASTLWAASATSYTSFLWARIVMGLGAAGIETLTPVTIVDACFLHERGLWNSIYFLALFGGADLGGVVSGVIAGSTLGWHWFFWVTSILLGACSVAVIVLMPETAWERVPTADIAEDQRVLGTGKPARSAFSLLPKRVTGSISPMSALLRPLPVFFAPTVLYSSLMFGFFACMFLVANVAQSSIFQVNYGFSVTQTGLTNFAFLFGQLAGLPMSGWFSDWISMRATKRNNMIREPEMRLVALVPTIATAAVGLLLLGCTAEAKTHWMGPIMGLVVLGAGVTATCVISVTYAIDCHKVLSGEVMLVATILKNVLSFGFAQFTSSWIASQHLRTPFLILMGVALFLGIGPSMLMYFYGKRLRRFIAAKNLLPQGKGILAE